MPHACPPARPQVRRRFDAVNGLLIPGGSQTLRPGEPFYDTVAELFNLALDANDAGDYFPVSEQPGAACARRRRRASSHVLHRHVRAAPLVPRRPPCPPAHAHHTHTHAHTHTRRSTAPAWALRRWRWWRAATTPSSPTLTPRTWLPHSFSPTWLTSHASSPTSPARRARSHALEGRGLWVGQLRGRGGRPKEVRR